MKTLSAAALLFLFSALPAAAQDTLRFSDLDGWWSADPVRGGESSHVALQFLVGRYPERLAQMGLIAS